MDDPYGSKEKQTGAPKIGDMFEVAADKVDLLKQKLDVVNAQLGDQEHKLSGLMQQYQALGDEELDTDAAREIDAQITAVQSKMISLQQSANQTEAAIAKASSDSAGKISEDANKSSGTVGKAMKSVRKKIGDAFKGAGNTAGKHLQSINRKVSGLSRSVKSAFKSAFLMAGLYAAFRGIK